MAHPPTQWCFTGAVAEGVSGELRYHVRVGVEAQGVSGELRHHVRVGVGAQGFDGPAEALGTGLGLGMGLGAARAGVGCSMQDQEVSNLESSIIGEKHAKMRALRNTTYPFCRNTIKQ